MLWGEKIILVIIEYGKVDTEYGVSTCNTPYGVLQTPILRCTVRKLYGGILIGACEGWTEVQEKINRRDV